MRRVRFARVARCGLAASLLAATLTLSGTGAPAVDTRPAATTYPTNAAKVFRWGSAQVKDEFKAPLSSVWSVNRSSLVRNQHGMLTLDSAASNSDVVATWTGRARRHGRWEARVRGRQYGTTGAPYRLVWELVPAGAANCGARGIVLSDYTLGTNTATVHLRNLPAADFTASKVLPLRNNEFHTYAVEVAPDHISWFVDTKVVMTERRPAARTGAAYSVRFRLEGERGAGMKRGRMQMDWVRYYTLARPNARPITAPQARLTTYGDAC